MKPAIGRIVHYKVAESDGFAKWYEDGLLDRRIDAGELLPAIIVHDWGKGCVNLQVFVDGPAGTKYRTSVVEGSEPGDWSWPLLIFEVDPKTVATEEAAAEAPNEGKEASE